jgi:outer membrane protein assembly factor BamE (lipoprotein component of BamABCDE complex)
MKMMANLMLSVFLILSVFGCSVKSISHGSEITEEQVAKIVDGKTTKDEIFIEFGNPSKTMDNEKVFLWETRDSDRIFLFGLEESGKGA